MVHDWSFAKDYHSQSTKAKYVPMYNTLCKEDTQFQARVIKNDVQMLVTGHLNFDHVDYFLPGRPQIVTKNCNDDHCRIIKLKGKN